MPAALCPEQIELNSRPTFKFDCYSGFKLLSNHSLGNFGNSELIPLLLNFKSFSTMMSNNLALT